jgi:hypothetical protein
MRLRDILIGALSALAVTIIGGIIVYYLTTKPSGDEKEQLVYRIEPPTAFESDASRVAFQNITIRNVGRGAAKNVGVVVDFEHQATIKDKSIVSSSGAASGLEVVSVTSNALSLRIPSLISNESVKVVFLLDARPARRPIVSVKSDLTVGVVGDVGDATPSSSAVTRIVRALLPLLAVAQLGLLLVYRSKVGAQKTPNNTAFVLLHRGRTTDAEGLLRRTIEGGMADGYVFSNYALCLAVKSDFDDADNFLKASAMFDKSRSAGGVWCFNAALIAFLRGDATLGTSHLRAAIKLKKRRIIEYCEESSIFEGIALKYRDEIRTIPELKQIVG